ncbi:hypothetical protein [Celeribacter marinus]|uniref:hypothetical protein n=1 Tax=Celeribacter marinus TaxID=1397108 RepID=UPI003F6B52D7
MDHLPSLTSDCSQCAALCCVGLTLDQGEMFAIDKPSGTPCPNLSRDCRCTIHTDLVDKGMVGCTLYECAGAGQRVVQMRFNGESWRDDPTLLPAMMRDFNALKPLHERMAQLVEAGMLDLTPDVEAERVALLTRHARVWSDSDTLRNRLDAFVSALAQANP